MKPGDDGEEPGGDGEGSEERGGDGEEPGGDGVDEPGADGEEPGGDGVDEPCRSLASAPAAMSVAESDSHAAPSMNISN